MNQRLKRSDNRTIGIICNNVPLSHWENTAASVCRQKKNKHLTKSMQSCRINSVKNQPIDSTVWSKKTKKNMLLALHVLLKTTETLKGARQSSQSVQETITLHPHMYRLCSSPLSQSWRSYDITQKFPTFLTCQATSNKKHTKFSHQPHNEYPKAAAHDRRPLFSLGLSHRFNIT